MHDESLITNIENCLAQTQCRECGYNGCRPYAEAIAAGEVAHNRCKPGGSYVIKALAKLLDKPMLEPHHSQALPQKVIIDEEACIGCTICIQNCPTDAIIGAPKAVHSLVEEGCTGCGLCVPVCPVKCISFTKEQLVPIDEESFWQRARFVKRLVEAKNARRESLKARKLAVDKNGGEASFKSARSLKLSEAQKRKIEEARSQARIKRGAGKTSSQT